MLKIERTANGMGVFFRLSGRIEAEELAELESLVKAETGRNIWSWISKM